MPGRRKAPKRGRKPKVVKEPESEDVEEEQEEEEGMSSGGRVPRKMPRLSRELRIVLTRCDEPPRATPRQPSTSGVERVNGDVDLENLVVARVPTPLVMSMSQEQEMEQEGALSSKSANASPEKSSSERSVIDLTLSDNDDEAVAVVPVSEMSIDELVEPVENVGEDAVGRLAVIEDAFRASGAELVREAEEFDRIMDEIFNGSHSSNEDYRNNLRIFEKSSDAPLAPIPTSEPVICSDNQLDYHNNTGDSQNVVVIPPAAQTGAAAAVFSTQNSQQQQLERQRKMPAPTKNKAQTGPPFNFTMGSSSDSDNEMDVDQQEPAPPQPPQQNTPPPVARRIPLASSSPLRFDNQFQNLVTPVRLQNNGPRFLTNGFRHIHSSDEEIPVDGDLQGSDDFLCDISAIEGDHQSVFTSPPPSPLKVMWYCTILWDSKLLLEMNTHEQMGGKLFTSMGIGKLFIECFHKISTNWPGLRHMYWRRRFIVLDIITDDYTTCGRNPCLRVQEKICADSPGTSPVLWDLVISPQCESLAREMTRLYKTGVKTTVILWGYQETIYSSNSNVKGELELWPTNLSSEILSVLILHHENLPNDRGRHIVGTGNSQDSELFEDFQNWELGYKSLVYSNVVDTMPTMPHVEVHIERPYNSRAPLNVPMKPVSPMGRLSDAETDNDDSEEEDLHGFEQFNNIPWDESDAGDADDLDGTGGRVPTGYPEESEPPEAIVSVSRQASVDEAPEIFNISQMAQVAEQLFCRPKTTPVKGQEQNRVQVDGVSGLTIANVSRHEELQENGEDHRMEVEDPVNPEPNESTPNQPNGPPNISDSQKQFLYTQELVPSDSDEEDGNETKQNGVNGHDSDLDDSFVTCVDEQQSKDSPVRVIWGKGKPLANGQNGGKKTQTNGKNGGAVKSAGASGANKGKGKTIQSQQRQQKESQESEMFSFTNQLNEL